jgi:hypothetical protein
MRRNLGWWLQPALALCLTSCIGANDEGGEPAEKFGIIDDRGIKNWSALWHVSQHGSVEFCLREIQSNSERQRIENAARNAVDGWVNLLNDADIPSGFTQWRDRRVTTTFGCSRDAYTIAMKSGGGGVCSPREKSIRLGRNARDQVLAHEFGHAMGMADTYVYGSGGAIPGQPTAMMQNAQRFTRDDEIGALALWHFINTGKIRCGPGTGYVRSNRRSSNGHPLCEPGQGDDDNDDDNDGGGCEDSRQYRRQCPQWARAGFCDDRRYRRFMRAECCGSCS